MQPMTAHVLNHWQDSPEALPAHALEHRCTIRYPHSHTPTTGVQANITTASHELTRMREHPELYEDWHIDLMLDAREAELTALGLVEWDCGTCGRWVVTPDIRCEDVPTPAQPCPKCGAIGDYYEDGAE